MNYSEMPALKVKIEKNIFGYSVTTTPIIDRHCTVLVVKTKGEAKNLARELKNTYCPVVNAKRMEAKKERELMEQFLEENKESVEEAKKEIEEIASSDPYEVLLGIKKEK